MMRYSIAILAVAVSLLTGCRTRSMIDWNDPPYLVYLRPHMMVPETIHSDFEDTQSDEPAYLRIPQPSVMPGLTAAELEERNPRTAMDVADAIIEAEQERQAEAEDGQFHINAIEVYDYERGRVYPVITSPGFVTTLELQAGESVLNIAGGDSANWVIDAIAGGVVDQQQADSPADRVRTYVLIKPRSPFQKTNLIITTDRRAYHLELASLDTPTYHTAINWAYPQGNNLVIRRTGNEQVSEIVERNHQLTSHPVVNYGYNVLVKLGKVNPAWTPLRVYDDGRQVFIEFTEESRHFSRPVLMAKQPDGSDRLINYRIEGNHLITQRLFTQAELRLGTQSVRIDRLNTTHYAQAPR